MADKEIQFKLDLLINNADAASSVKEVRQSVKDLQSALLGLEEGSDEFVKVSQKAGQLQDKLSDVKDSIKSFNASPIENVTNSFTSLISKVKSLDFGGAKQQLTNLVTSTNQLAKSFLGIQEGAGYASIGMKGLGKAFAATGIGLLVTAVVLLIANFDKLKTAGGFLGDALKTIGDIVQSTIKFFTDLTDAIGLTAIAANKAADEQIAAQQRINDSVQYSYEYQIALAKAKGQDTYKLELARLESLKQVETQKLGEISDIQSQAYQDQLAKRAKVFDDIEILTAAHDKKLADDAKKSAEELAKDQQKADEDAKKSKDKYREDARKALQKQIQDLKDSNELNIKQQVDGSLEELKAREDGNKKLTALYSKFGQDQLNLLGITETQRKLVIQDANDDSIKANKIYYDNLDKQCQELEDKITATKKAAEDKRLADQIAADAKSRDSFISGEQDKDDISTLNIIKAGTNQKKVQAAEIAANEERIKRFKGYSAFELEQLGLTETQRQIIVAQSEQNITNIQKQEQQKRIENVQQGLSEIAKQFQETAAIIGGVGGAVLNGLGNITNSVSAAIKTFSDENATLGDKINAGLEVANQTVGMIGDALAAKSNERITAVQTEKEEQIKALEDQNKRGLISDEQLSKGKDKINQEAYKKDLALRRKAFQQQKAIQIVQAVIGTAQGIVSALANPFPLNIVMAALAGVTGAVNIGLIAAQKFPEGGSAPSTSTPSTPSASAEGLVNATSPNQFVPPQFQSIGDNRFNNGGDNNLFVLVDDINKGQRKVSVIEDRSTVL